MTINCTPWTNSAHFYHRIINSVLTVNPLFVTLVYEVEEEQEMKALMMFDLPESSCLEIDFWEVSETG